MTLPVMYYVTNKIMCCKKLHDLYGNFYTYMLIKTITYLDQHITKQKRDRKIDNFDEFEYTGCKISKIQVVEITILF